MPIWRDPRELGEQVVWPQCGVSDMAPAQAQETHALFMREVVQWTEMCLALPLPRELTEAAGRTLSPEEVSPASRTESS